MSEPKGRYVKYSQYREPDADWLANIPTQWDIAKVKSLLCLKKGQVGENSTNHQLLSLTLGGVIPRDIADGGKLPADFNTYQVVEPGNLVFCLFDIDETPRTVGYSEHSGMITGAYNVYSTTPKADGKFVYYYFLHIDSFKGLKPYYTGLRKVVRADTFASIKMPLPFLSEQTLIANFLDYETAKIDTLIDKQQQLIKLLKEKRQAVISHTVTNGLNPDAPMKDSGVEWLGEVPEHWDVVRMRYLCRITTGGRDTQDAKEDGEYPFFVRSDTIERIDTYSFDGEGVMTSGDGAGVGKIFHHFIGRCEIHQRVYLFHHFKNIKGRLLYLFIKENLGRIVLAQSAKSTVDSLRLPMLQDFPICFGDEPEQKQICEYVDGYSLKIENLVAKAESSIILLRERRTALISAAVTGKIDVRNWQPEHVETRMEASA